MADDFAADQKAGKQFASHRTVVRRDYEYVRGNVRTNSLVGSLYLTSEINEVFQNMSSK